MWSRTVRDALEARSVYDNDSDSDRSDASTPTSSPTRPAPNRRRTAALAKIPASGEDVHAPATELDPAETLLYTATAAEEEEEEEEIPSQRAAVSPDCFSDGTCRGDIIALFVCRRQMLSPL
jgi:hypothetical protein